MYSRSEYKILKEEFGNDFISIAIHAKPALRYSRLEERIIRPLTNLEARSRDHSEIENIEK
jgi:dephospho-CoA kinase